MDLIQAPGQVTYTPDVASEICDRLANAEGLWSICRDPHMPSRQSVFNWVRDNEEFRARYEAAMAVSVDAMADDADHVSRDASRDYREIPTRDGGVAMQFDHEHVQRSKLIVDTLKWRAAVLAPHKYGDRVALQALDERGKPARMGGVVVIIDGAPAPGKDEK